jgi:hypothetical protein
LNRTFHPQTKIIPTLWHGGAAGTLAPMRVDGPVGRVVQRAAGSRWFARVAPPILTPLDRFLHRLTGGRVLLSRGLLPSLLLTTTGARSGLPREVPLACVPDGDVIYLVGSNFGRERHPACGFPARP